MPQSGRTRRSRSRSQNRNQIQELSALHRAGLAHRTSDPSNIPRGQHRMNARLPLGTPNTANLSQIHRLGSRVRSYTERMMQRERQLSRRRPDIAALRLAHTRPVNIYEPSNIRRFVNPSLAENIVQPAIIAKTGRSKYNKTNEPLPIMAHATPYPSMYGQTVKGIPNESVLWEQWNQMRQRI